MARSVIRYGFALLNGTTLITTQACEEDTEKTQLINAPEIRPPVEASLPEAILTGSGGDEPDKYCLHHMRQVPRKATPAAL